MGFSELQEEYIESDKTKMNRKLVIVFLSFFLLLVSCKKKEKTVVDNPQYGTITMAVDQSFQSVSEALTDRYMSLNPQTKINLVVQKEDLAFLDLLERKVRVIIMSRELSKEEKEAFKSKLDLDLEPGPFAADAVVFFVSKDSPRQNITVEEIKTELQSDEKKIIFDGTNSSNLNFVAQKMNTTPAKLKYSIINGNENVVKEINNHPEKIGAISLNTLSRPYDPESEKIRNSIRILPVVSSNVAYEPSLQNLRNNKYPFTRILYFLTNERYYGLGNGLIRFSCQQLGQIVVKKEGLQPYYIFNREVKMQ